MDPWMSWAILGVFGFGVAYYYTQSGRSRRSRGRTSQLVSAEQSQRRGSDQRNDSKDKRKKKTKLSDTSGQPGSDVANVSSASVQNNTNGTVKKRKGGKKQPSKLAQSSAVEVSPEQGVGTEIDIAEAQDIDNEEFARQLSGLKTGTSLKKPVTQNGTKKSKKQGKRNETAPQAMNGSASKTNGVASSQNMSTASSTTGTNADDDLSPTMSPDLRATQATIPTGTDVSDMLEPAPKGPSILRITEPVNPQPIRQSKVQKAAREPETKKQRQNRQKNEEKKAIREQDEKERRALLEKQLRTVREAEGRPARNGFGASKTPSANVWDKPGSAATDSIGPATKQSSASLLDTFEDVPTTAGNSRSSNDGVNGVSVDKKVWNNDLPSEEEQMRIITEMDSDNTWSTVTKGGKSKKKSPPTTTADKVSSGNLQKETSSVYSASLATSADNNKTHPKSSDYKGTSSTMSATSAEHSNTSSGAEKKHPPAGEMTSKEEDLSKTASSHTNDSNNTESAMAKEEDVNKTATSHTNDINEKESAMSEAGDDEEPGHVKATFETIDHSVWTRENITEHPDYDPDFPYALTGHPDDDDWPVC